MSNHSIHASYSRKGVEANQAMVGGGWGGGAPICPLYFVRLTDVL